MPILTAEERVGRTLANKYALGRILGRGGFGVVLEGVHEWTGRRVAAKILDHTLSRQEEFVRRFLREARTAAQLDHPNVVDVLDMGQDEDGSVFLVLELLEGDTLRQAVKTGAPMSVAETLGVLEPVMDALAEAHRLGIVHRDLKPDNIFLAQDSRGKIVPKLLDFGIAKVNDPSGGTGTSTGSILGTPWYMAPEQARGAMDVGPAADVWSMGVVLWKCLSNTLPFTAETSVGVLGVLISSRAKPFATVSPGTPPAIQAIIDRALQHDVPARYPDMGAMLADVRAAIASLDIVPTITAPERRPATADGAISGVLPAGSAISGPIVAAASSGEMPRVQVPDGDETVSAPSFSSLASGPRDPEMPATAALASLQVAFDGDEPLTVMTPPIQFAPAAEATASAPSASAPSALGQAAPVEGASFDEPERSRGPTLWLAAAACFVAVAAGAALGVGYLLTNGDGVEARELPRAAGTEPAPAASEAVAETRPTSADEQRGEAQAAAEAAAVEAAAEEAAAAEAAAEEAAAAEAAAEEAAAAEAAAAEAAAAEAEAVAAANAAAAEPRGARRRTPRARAPRARQPREPRVGRNAAPILH